MDGSTDKSPWNSEDCSFENLKKSMSDFEKMERESKAKTVEQLIERLKEYAEQVDEWNFPVAMKSNLQAAANVCKEYLKERRIKRDATLEGMGDQSYKRMKYKKEFDAETQKAMDG